MTEISDVAELREEGAGSLAALARLLRAFGVSVSEKPDGLVIEGEPDRPLKAATRELRRRSPRRHGGGVAGACGRRRKRD